ncbi:KilA-N domain-containing protein [Vibrio coralliilyticus]|uniref:KilA-N domain-containing protein n=1 Tax=Vibrio coralliilyticus TaxID=190893 RepID=A0AAP6ZMJ6_9VIBR|nr:KilA-N domain-containing protein [Vibrio coralliilyticus]NOJ22155.1 KilA-N domain-containing protein [Vibrio coralliilyticus]
MPNLTILSKDIRLLDNLYSLNDLHKASGGSKNHKPIQFLRNQQTQELINEIEQSANSHFAVNTKRGGCNSGTWVCKELVYSYAMWISPKFHLNVIRAFDSMSTNNAPQLPSPNPPSDLSLNDLIYELAKAKNVTTQNIHIHYNSVFNTNAWSQEQGFEHALAKRILKQDLANELRTQSPQLQLLKQQAKEHGLALVDEQEYQGFQGRMQMQQQQIEKLVDDLMALSRNHNSLMSQVM